MKINHASPRRDNRINIIRRRTWRQGEMRPRLARVFAGRACTDAVARGQYGGDEDRSCGHLLPAIEHLHRRLRLCQPPGPAELLCDAMDDLCRECDSGDGEAESRWAGRPV